METTDPNAQALILAFQALQTMTPGQALGLLLCALLGLAFSMTMQAFIEHNVAEKPWMNAKLKGLKPLLPALFSAVIGAIAQHFGVPVPAVAAVVAGLTAGTHLVNASDKLAAEVPRAEQAGR